MERTEEEVRSRRGAGRLGLQRGHGGMGWRGHVRLILLKDRAAAELMVVRSPRKPPTVHSYSGGTRTSRRHAAWQAPPASALSRSRARTRRSPRHMARMTTGANGVQPEVHAEHNARTQSAGAYVGEVRARGAGQLGAPGHAAPKQWCFPIRSLMLGRNRRLHPIQTRRKESRRELRQRRTGGCFPSLSRSRRSSRVGPPSDSPSPAFLGRLLVSEAPLPTVHLWYRGGFDDEHRLSENTETIQQACRPSTWKLRLASCPARRV